MDTRQEQRANKALDGLVTAAGTTLVLFERRASQLNEEGVQLVGMSVRFPTEDDTDYMVVIRAATESTRLVGFGGGLTLMDALRSTLERVYNRRMKWKEDEYAK